LYSADTHCLNEQVCLRRNHTPGFKAKVALAAIKGDRTITQLAEHFDVQGRRSFERA
jgi:transposase-like protein